MDKKKSWSRKILILFFALLLVLALVFILYGMIRASINSNAIIRESSFIASSANIIQGLISEWKLNEEILKDVENIRLYSDDPGRDICAITY